MQCLKIPPFSLPSSSRVSNAFGSMSNEPLPFDRGTPTKDSMKVIPYMSAPPRTRTALACDKCRERKTKCSGEHPACQRCKARGLICVYGSRDSKGRYQSTFAVTKSHSTSSLHTAAAAGANMIQASSSVSNSRSAEKRARSVEQATLPPDGFSSQNGLSYWPPMSPFQSLSLDSGASSSSTPYQHERQRSHPFFTMSEQMSSISYFDMDPTNRHARSPNHRGSSSHPTSIDYSNVTSAETPFIPRSQPIYPVDLNYKYSDTRGHRQGLSMSSVSTCSSGSASIPATPIVMNYPAPFPTYKPDQGVTMNHSGSFVNVYRPTEDHVQATSSQIDGYNYGQGHSEHLLADTRETSHSQVATGGRVAAQAQNSFMAHGNAGHNGPNPNVHRTSSSTLDGALGLDPFG
ncbi:hypothetical protein K435DRAFT_959280 [Dendrothele bispora CBS 962.96]|uniref:Zn(2)-C6 fungal-type domain-containing protein n=1 Tax=Dendrothele bispora (strain CBS 962.96) TaxID=1314807 RepID=A0A4V4HIS5_DENBC|nr:hypothetical protein K435DRAFT_959280 [Dendrothele bispora CBS 962.96]